MSGSQLRRAASLWLGLLLLTAAACAVTIPFFREAHCRFAFRVTRDPVASGALSSLLSWMTPSVLFCGGTMLAGTTVFCRSFLRAGCVFRGIAAGVMAGLLGCGRLTFSHPRISVFLCVAELAFWLAEGACTAAFSEELFRAYGKGDGGGFRSALQRGFGAALTFSGCVFAVSALGWLAA